MRTPPFHLLTFASLFLSLLACCSSPLSAPKSDALEDFCSGSTPKAVINGVASKVNVVGKVDLVMQCCEGASFTVSSSSFDYKVRALWALQFGHGDVDLANPYGHDDFPARVDLAHPEEGWRSWVELTCSSGEVCYPLPDSYDRDSAMQGWLEVSRLRADDFASGYHMGICMRVAEAPENPHPLLHSFELFAPDITAAPSR